MKNIAAVSMIMLFSAFFGLFSSDVSNAEPSKSNKYYFDTIEGSSQTIRCEITMPDGWQPFTIAPVQMRDNEAMYYLEAPNKILPESEMKYDFEKNYVVAVVRVHTYEQAIREDAKRNPSLFLPTTEELISNIEEEGIVEIYGVQHGTKGNFSFVEYQFKEEIVNQFAPEDTPYTTKDDSIAVYFSNNKHDESYYSVYFMLNISRTDENTVRQLIDSINFV